MVGRRNDVRARRTHATDLLRLTANSQPGSLILVVQAIR